jgi:hypothetical protein
VFSAAPVAVSAAVVVVVIVTDVLLSPWLLVLVLMLVKRSRSSPSDGRAVRWTHACEGDEHAFDQHN